MNGRRTVFGLASLLLLTGIVNLTVTGCTANSAVYEPKKTEWEEVKMVANPITLPVKPQDGAADPFILRHNGWYYLYTTGVVNIWRSKDLADWTYVGTANSQNPLNAAFAPEVYYWNGKFYMYTSPSGNGHFVLRADHPTGPFEPVTENIGLTIDGSVFIEDDGSWYFTHASTLGILGHTMTSPTEIDLPGDTLKSSYMGHWTEGPMILKRDGRYFMTYTGNHYQSSGYRVNYSVSEEDPLGPYHRPDNNPILINDLNSQHALGHSSYVTGPDLDSVYIAYHCYSGNAPSRLLNIDRLSFNGSRMIVNGPTSFPMPVAELPRFALWPEENPASHMEKIAEGDFWMILSRERTEEKFTAEWNLAGGDGDTGVVFCRNDKGSDIRLLWEKEAGGIKAEKHHNGTVETLEAFDLPEGFDRKVLHTIKVQYSPRMLDVYFDNMHKLAIDDPGLSGGRIGYLYTGTPPDIGFTGFSDVYKGSGDGPAVKPVPGRFDAIHHLPGKDTGFGGSVDIGSLPGDVRTLRLKKKGAWASYAVNTEKDGYYGISLQINQNGGKVANGRKAEIFLDGKSLGTFSIGEGNVDDKARAKAEKEEAVDFVVVPLGRIPLSSGMHRLAIRLARGKDLEILSLQLYETDDSGLPAEYPLIRRKKDMKIIGNGSFEFTREGMKALDRADMKMVIGSKAWTDYTAEVSVTPGTFGMGRSGLMIRSTNESYHPHQNNNAMQGYFAGMESDGIFLWRMNYEDSKVIEKVPFRPEKGKTYTLRVTAEGSSIRVYLDDMEKPIISYTDPMPYLFGRVGIWSFKDEAVYKNLEIKTDLNSPI